MSQVTSVHCRADYKIECRQRGCQRRHWNWDRCGRQVVGCLKKTWRQLLHLHCSGTDSYRYVLPTSYTQIKGQLSGLPATYTDTGSAWFNSRPERSLSWHIYFATFVCLSRHIPGELKREGGRQMKEWKGVRNRNAKWIILCWISARLFYY